MTPRRAAVLAAIAALIVAAYTEQPERRDTRIALAGVVEAAPRSPAAPSQVARAVALRFARAYLRLERAPASWRVRRAIRRTAAPALVHALLSQPPRRPIGWPLPDRSVARVQVQLRRARWAKAAVWMRHEPAPMELMLHADETGWWVVALG